MQMSWFNLSIDNANSILLQFQSILPEGIPPEGRNLKSKIRNLKFKEGGSYYGRSGSKDGSHRS
jgi:hypothetical protein